MCVIMVKPKGIPLPCKEVFKICYNNNSDGCGYMYVENGKVVVKKGFMGYKNMYKQIKKLGDDKVIVVHFRIGTSGVKKDQKTCHPYPISTDENDLQKLQYNTDVGVVHNGIISGYVDDKRPDLNDTQVFVRDFLTVLKDLNPEFYKNKKARDLIENEAGSKLVFLDSNEDLYYVGEYNEDNGVLYSNYTYTYNYYYPKVYDYTYDYINEIDYDNYIELEAGWTIEKSYNDYIIVQEDDNYAVDSNGNLFKLYNGFPSNYIIATGVYIFDENYEEVEIL